MKLIVLSQAIRTSFRKPGSRLFTTFVHIPLGVVFFLVLAWIAELVIRKLPFTFSPPVAAMGVLFACLGVVHAFAPKLWIDNVMRIIAPPADWTLRHMSIFFVPNFVIIPAREILPAKEVGLVAAWFLVSQCLCCAAAIGLHCLIMRIRHRRIAVARFSTWSNYNLTVSGNSSFRASSASVLPRTPPAVLSPEHILSRRAIHIPLMPRSHRNSVTCHPTVSSATVNNDNSMDPTDLSRPNEGRRSRASTVAFTSLPGTTCGPTQASQNLTSTSPRLSPLAISPATTPSKLPPADYEKDWSLAQANCASGEITRVASRADAEISVSIHNEEIQESGKQDDDDQQRTLRTNENVEVDKDNLNNVDVERGDDKAEDPQAKAFEDLTKKFEKHFCDILLYSLLVFVGLPIFFALNESTTGENSIPAASLPFFLGINVLAYLFSIHIVPQTWRKYLHPIIVTAFLTFFIIWAFGAMKGYSLSTVLHSYSTSTTYIELFQVERWRGPAPGAGDLLSSCLHAGIVSLALPMYRFRHDLRAYILSILAMVFTMSVLGLLFWPFIARLIGLEPTDALAFLPRFTSTPLAIEIAEAVDANLNLMVPLVVVTGIIMVITKDWIFKLFRIEDDFLGIGLTVGAISGAIGTSSLNSTNPRAMAIATVTFVLFGATLLILVAIPDIVKFAQAVGSVRFGAAG